MSEKIKINFVEKQKIKINLKEGIAGPRGAIGTTGAASTVPGPAGATGAQGATGTTGADGLNTDHAILSNLDYDNAGHTDFQKSLVYIPSYKAYQIE